MRLLYWAWFFGPCPTAWWVTAASSLLFRLLGVKLTEDEREDTSLIQSTLQRLYLGLCWMFSALGDRVTLQKNRFAVILLCRFSERTILYWTNLNIDPLSLLSLHFKTYGG